ncbi:flagellar basal-body rod protein FlgC [Alphaproteobacteria bacterium]|nr:flagellar basal-body rod protein FlgC [Alphaproteobacteria bacterium]
MDDLMASASLAVAGMKAQAKRLRVISQNMANADSLAKTRGGDPYRRQVISFRQALDRAMGAKKPVADKVMPDQSQFGQKYEPSHPMADAAGYVKTPNVNMLVEIMDMREAELSYQANTAALMTSRSMAAQTLDLLNN